MKKKDYKTVTETTTEHMQKLNAFFLRFHFLFLFQFSISFWRHIFRVRECVCFCAILLLSIHSTMNIYISVGVCVCSCSCLWYIDAFLNLGRTNWNRCKIPKYEVDLRVEATVTTKHSTRQTLCVCVLFFRAFVLLYIYQRI